MPSSKSNAKPSIPVMSAPGPAAFPSGAYVSPTNSEATDVDIDETSDSPFFSNAEMELRAPVFDREAEAAYQADEDTAGFPGPFAYQTIVYEYLKGLSSKKREKALLNVTMYSAVMYVLNNPKDTAFKTAQFRFWAKKMFCLTEYEGDWVLTHDGKPVACREQMHGVLKHCHAIAGHGGRDKTSAEFYSWIPKEIVARFVQMCPSCKSKRTLSSATLGVMTGPQTFFCNLQNTEQKLSKGQPITLAQARAHAQSAMHARQKQQQTAAVGRGRVHNVGSSSHPPQNAVNYGVPQYTSTYPQAPPQHHDGPFGQADYFQPQHQSIPAGAFPRSVSFDESAPNAQYYSHIHDARRVSAPVYPSNSIVYSPRAAMWNAQQQQQQQQQAPALPAYMPIPLPQEADFDSLGDVREACGTSAKQSLEEQAHDQSYHQSSYAQPSYDHHRGAYSGHSLIDPSLVEHPYLYQAPREYYPAPTQEIQYDRMPVASSQYYAAGHLAVDPTISFEEYAGDHDSPLSVNELEFADVADGQADAEEAATPDGLREALDEFTNHDLIGFA